MAVAPRWDLAGGFTGSGNRPQRALVLIVAWLALTGVMIALGSWVAHSTSITTFDRHVTSVVVAHRSPALNVTMRTVTWLGSWGALVATGILLAVLVLCRRLPRLALVLAVVAWAGESGGVTLAKYAVERQRPPQNIRLVPVHGGSWPSGHAAAALVVFTALTLVVVTLVPGSGCRVLAWGLAIVAVAAVAFSRIELGVHWTTDVIASLAFVGAWLMVLGTVFRRDIRRTRTASATAPSSSD